MNRAEELTCGCAEQPKNDKHIIAILADNNERLLVALNLTRSIEQTIIGARRNDAEIVIGANCVRGDVETQGKALDILVDHLQTIYNLLAVPGCR